MSENGPLPTVLGSKLKMLTVLPFSRVAVKLTDGKPSRLPETAIAPALLAVIVKVLLIAGPPPTSGFFESVVTFATA